MPCAGDFCHRFDHSHHPARRIERPTVGWAEDAGGVYFADSLLLNNSILGYSGIYTPSDGTDAVDPSRPNNLLDGNLLWGSMENALVDGAKGNIVGRDLGWVVEPSAGDYEDPIYKLTARTFDEVYLHATRGGFDRAEFHDTARDDLLEVTTDWVQLSTQKEDLDMLYRAIAFERVKAYSVEGHDTVQKPDVVDFVQLELDGLWFE